MVFMQKRKLRFIEVEEHTNSHRIRVQVIRLTQSSLWLLVVSSFGALNLIEGTSSKRMRGIFVVSFVTPAFRELWVRSHFLGEKKQKKSEWLTLSGWNLPF